MVTKRLPKKAGTKSKKDELSELRDRCSSLEADIKSLKFLFDDLKNKAVVAVDLSIKGSQLIIIEYNHVTSGVKVIASENFKDPQYQKIVRGLRQYMVQYNAEFLVVDAEPNTARLIESRVLNGLDQAFNIAKRVDFEGEG